VNNVKANEMEKVLSGTAGTVMVGCDWSLPVGFVERMVDSHGDDRLVFGSNVSLHYYQSSLLQIRMAEISEKSKRKILGGNLRKLL
jgi:predicted TIM-barrel fold metal-dependent hydrolase